MRAGEIYRLAGMLMAAMLISEGGAAAAGTDTVYAAATAKAGKSTAAKKAAKAGKSTAAKKTAKAGKGTAAKKTAASGTKQSGKKTGKSSSKKATKNSSQKAGKKASYASAYQDILKDYLNGTNYFDFGGITSNMTWPEGEAPENPEFALFDFNADGVPELLVGDNWSYGSVGWMMYTFDGKAGKAVGTVTGYDPATGGFLCLDDVGWVLYNYDGTQLIETGEAWSGDTLEDVANDVVVYYPVGGDAVTLTTEAASAIAAQYQAIGTLVPVTELNQANVSAVK